MVNLTILAGGYTSFIASYTFNTGARLLSYNGQTETNANPSWITPHLTNSSILFATNENTQGGLQSFLVGAGGALTPFTTISTDGNGPAFARMLSTGEVAAMNYGSGNGAFAPLQSHDPLGFGSNVDITFPIREQGNVSHPHMAYEFENEVFIPDLGQDTVWRVGKDKSTGEWAIHGEIPQPTGSGPRHMAIFDHTLYIAHELASSLTAQPLPASPNGTSEIKAQLKTFPAEDASLSGAVWAAAEILIPPPNDAFPTPFVYVSNRNTGTTTDPRGDSVAIFSIQPEVKLIQQVFTGMQQIRGMEFGGENSEWLILSGVVGEGGVAVFERTHGGANMSLVSRDTTVPTRTSFVWGDW